MYVPRAEQAAAPHPGPLSVRTGRGDAISCRLSGVLLAIVALAAFVLPATAEPRHGLSAFGDLKYPAEFKSFEYVNPDAPKGGRISMIGAGGTITFDSFNAFIIKGDPAQGMEDTFDTLMVRAHDEPDAVYGLIAKSADVAPDRMSVTFALRPEAKFSDGTPLTAEDVAFSLEILKTKGDPRYALVLRDVAKAEVLDPHRVKYTFTGTLVRDLPMMVATLPVFSKAYYASRDFSATTLEPPLGSGPYRIDGFKPGTYVTFKRRDDYWAKDLPVNRGRFNFDEVRYEYYRDRTAEIEALFSGTFDFREEFTSKDWALAYEGKPAIKDGRMLRLTVADERPSGAQGFFINTRRARFSDKRVRQALGLAFDFEWSNKNLFFGLYKRTNSYFENSDMKASGAPSPEELKLLEPFRDKLAPDVFREPYLAPVTDSTGGDRRNLREAQKLFADAGWKVSREEKADPDCGLFCKLMKSVGLKSSETQNILRNDKGEPFEIEFLTFEPGFDRIIGPYIKNLEQLGVVASIRRVDPAQYQNRLKSFDFDLIVQRYALSLTPGVELKTYWGSEAAKMDGSNNLAGISDPVVDALIDKVLQASSRAELETATRAIDRVLRAGHYWVPHWYKAAHNLAFWNKFSWPETKPKYERGAIETWWYDAAKAAKLEQN